MKNKTYLISLIVSIGIHAIIFTVNFSLPEYTPREIKELAINVEKVKEEMIHEPEIQTPITQKVSQEATSIPIDSFMKPHVKSDENSDSNEDMSFNLFDDDDDKFVKRTHTASTYAERDRDIVAPNSHIIDYDVHDIHESLGDSDPVKVNTKKFSKTKQDTTFITFTGTKDFFKNTSYGGDDSLIRSIFQDKEFDPTRKVSLSCKILFEIKDGKIKGSPKNQSGNSELAIWVIEILIKADKKSFLAPMKSGVYVLEYKNKLVDINQD